MAQQAACPQCHSSAAVQPVANVVGKRVRVRYTVPAEQAPLFAQRQTNLTELLAPPPRPRSGWLLLAALLGGLLLLSVPASCIVTMLLIDVRGLDTQAAQAALFGGPSQRLFLLIVGVAMLLSIVIVALIAYWRERRQRPEVERWTRQMNRWQQACFCYRCHVAFVPGATKAVAPEHMTQILAP